MKFREVTVKDTNMDLEFEDLKISGYYRVLAIRSPKIGLQAIIAIHDITLGPALGGIRIYPYSTFEAGLQDVLRLSEGMTYKSAMAGTMLGGGKSVIIIDPKVGKTKEILTGFARAIQSLDGMYIGGQDVGCTKQDIATIHGVTPYVAGIEQASGEPGPFTARGTFRGMEALAENLWGSPSLKGKKVAIQGLGSVGLNLAEILFWEGADLVVSDLSPERTDYAKRRFRAEVVSGEEILKQKCDILAPCAMGAILNEASIPLLQCAGIAGCANNQLLTQSDGKTLQDQGILYAPDFVINAGGLINISSELHEEGYNPKFARDQTDLIGKTTREVLALSKTRGEEPGQVALQLAKSKIEKARLENKVSDT